MVILIMQVV